MIRRSTDTARRAGLIAVAAALAAGVAAAGARLARRGSGGALAPLRGGGAGAVRSRFRGRAEQMYKCRCGKEYRVSGAGRHRVYWPDDAPDDSPVLGDRCVECEAPLPGRRATRPA